MSEITIDDQVYSIGKMDAMQQLHATRRLAPFLLAMLKAGTLRNGSKFDLNNFLNDTGDDLSRILSEMPDKQFEDIIWPCMEVIRMKQGPGWAPIKVMGQKMFQFQHIDGAVMLQLTIETLKANLALFFSGIMKSLKAVDGEAAQEKTA